MLNDPSSEQTEQASKCCPGRRKLLRVTGVGLACLVAVGVVLGGLHSQQRSANTAALVPGQRLCGVR